MVEKTPCFKLMLLGGKGSGKTSLLTAYQTSKFNTKVESSEAPSNLMIKVDLQTNNSQVEFWTWDLPGKDSFIGLSRMYLRDTNAALIVYDVTDAESLQAAERWLQELRETAPSDIMLALAGTKRDASGQHAISLQDGQNFAKKNQIPIFFEVSAKTRENLDALWTRLAMECYQRRNQFPRPNRDVIKLGLNNAEVGAPQQKKSGCYSF